MEMCRRLRKEVLIELRYLLTEFMRASDAFSFGVELCIEGEAIELAPPVKRLWPKVYVGNTKLSFLEFGLVYARIFSSSASLISMRGSCPNE